MKFTSVFLVFITIVKILHAQQPLVPYRIKDKMGYADTAGRIQVTPRFDRAGFFWYGFAEVDIDHLKGLVNGAGQQLIPCIYNKIKRITTISPDGQKMMLTGLVATTNSNKYGLYELPSGKLILDTVYQRVSPYGAILVEAVKSEHAHGVYNSRLHKWVVHPQYDNIYFLSDKKVLASKGNRKDTLSLEPSGPVAPKTTAKAAGKRSAMQPSTLPAGRADELPSTDEGLVAINDEAVMSSNPDSPELQEGIVRKDGKYGYRFQDKQAGIPAIYDSLDLTMIYMGDAGVKKNGKWGIVNAYHKVLLPLKYDQVDVLVSHHDQGLFSVINNGIKMIVDSNGKIYASGLDEIKTVADMFILKKGKQYGALLTIRSKHPSLIETAYNKIEPNIESLSLGGNNRLYFVKVYSGADLQEGYISENGRKYFED